MTALLRDPLQPQPLRTALQLLELAVVDGPARLDPLLTRIADPRCFRVPTYPDRKCAQVIKDLSNQLEASWPNPPSANLGKQLLELLQRLRHWPPKQRRKALQMVDDCVPLQPLQRWSTWWQKHDDWVAEAKLLLEIKPPPRRRLDYLRKQLLGHAEGAPPAFNSVDAAAAVSGLAALPDKALRQLRALLDQLPLVERGSTPRLRLLLLWHDLFASFDRREVTPLLRAARAYFSRESSRHSRAPWQPQIDSRDNNLNYAAPEWRLLSERGGHRLASELYRALELLRLRATESESKQDWLTPVHCSALTELLVLTRDGERAAGLLQQLSALGLVDHFPVPYSCMSVALRDLCDEDEAFGPLMLALDKADFEEHEYDDDDDRLGVASICCSAPSLRKLLAQLILNGELSRVLRIGGCALALRKLASPAVSFEPPQLEGALPRWTRRYPTSLASALRTLSSADAHAEQTAARILGKSFPDRAALRQQLQRMQLALEQGSAAKPEQLRKRMANLKKRTEQPATASPKKLETLQLKLHQAVERKQLEHYEKRLNEALLTALLPRLGVAPPWLFEQPCIGLLPALCTLPRSARRLAFRLLRARAGPYPWDLREAEPNRRLLQRLTNRGLDMAPWLDGIGIIERDSPRGRLLLQLERDPLEALLMGKHFDTCLGPGGMNFFSAVSNAVDINKRVLYGRDETGGVVGRCLLALRDDGAILSFHPYCHDKRYKFTTMVSDFVEQLARRMGSAPAPATGSVSCLLSSDWYDDGPVDVTGRYAALEDESTFRKSLQDICLDTFVAAARAALRPAELDALTLPLLLALPELQKRPELAIPLLDLVMAERRLGLDDQILAASRAFHAGAHDRARELMIDRVLPKLLRQASPRRPVEPETLKLLVKLGEPSLVLRLLQRSRSRSIRRWADDEADRIVVAASAHAALHRHKLAASLCNIVLARGPSLWTSQARELLSELAS